MPTEAVSSDAVAAGPGLADVLRRFADELPFLTAEQSKVVRDVTRCRTAALGGHVHECEQCGHREVRYNSCRNRHCPTCQWLEQARWLEARQADLLDVEYFHVVFTVPEQLHPLFHANRKLCYGLLFKAAAKSLQKLALDPKHLGARIGLTAVLHTWTQKLLFHPHLHCIVPGGGLAEDASRWVSCKSGFLLPVRALSKVFRGKLLSQLEKSVEKGELQIPAGDPGELMQQAARKQWVVYSKPPFGGPEQVLRYLGRYTHRIAISNSRIVALDDSGVTFRWKDRTDSDKTKVTSLAGPSFVRRFLMHVVPKGFMRIRHYGFLANAQRAKMVVRCRELIEADNRGEEDGGADATQTASEENWQQLLRRLTGVDVTMCPVCGEGRMLRKESVSSTCESGSSGPRARSP